MSRGQTDRADFDALIGPHLDAGYRTALAILRDPDAAHDAVQECRLRATAAFTRPRGEADIPGLYRTT
jgi:DNA-directed RNA polymerase specialized sigma24 family protein